MNDLFDTYHETVSRRLGEIRAEARSGGFDKAIDLIVEGLRHGGVLQAFGTGHSQGFAMEIAGRAGGFIASHAIALHDLVLLKDYAVEMLGSAELERDPTTVDDLWSLYELDPADVFLVASNSGANGSVVGLALRAKAEGHPVIAVTSVEHSRGVASKHPSGKRLLDVADVVIDNRAPFGDSAVAMGEGITMGPVSSLTSAYIAQLLTLGAADRLLAAGEVPGVFLSANVPGGDAHNAGLLDAYGARVNSYSRAPEQATRTADAR